METSQERPPFPPDRILYYQQQAQELLDRHGREFDRFIAGHERLVEIGNVLLETNEATGYNILLSENDMPLASDEPLIFYSNYIGRPRHFGLLLAEMEQGGVIAPDQVRFGNKASRVLYEGDWELVPEDEQLAVISSTDAEGAPTEKRVSQTTETIAIFSPRDRAQAIRIANLLFERTDMARIGAIEGSWAIPDIRATAILKPTLGERRFQEVVANILVEGEGQLIVARQRIHFPNPWRSASMGVNRKLARFLSSARVLP